MLVAGCWLQVRREEKSCGLRVTGCWLRPPKRHGETYATLREDGFSAGNQGATPKNLRCATGGEIFIRKQPEAGGYKYMRIYLYSAVSIRGFLWGILRNEE
jgi:hypothetical protein